MTVKNIYDKNIINSAIQKGWKIYVNGSQVPVKALINDTFIGVELNKGLNDIIKSLSILWLSAVFFSLFGYLIGITFGNSFQIFEFVKR